MAKVVAMAEANGSRERWYDEKCESSLLKVVATENVVLMVL